MGAVAAPVVAVGQPGAEALRDEAVRGDVVALAPVALPVVRRVPAGVAQRRLVQVRRSHPVQAHWRAGLRVAAAVAEAVVPAVPAPADVVRRVPPTAGPRSRRWR